MSAALASLEVFRVDFGFFARKSTVGYALGGALHAPFKVSFLPFQHIKPDANDCLSRTVMSSIRKPMSTR